LGYFSGFWPKLKAKQALFAKGNFNWITFLAKYVKGASNMAKRKRSTTSTPVPPPPENILFVVMHGFISLVDTGGKEDAFLAYVLDMGDEHAYLYGDWLYEEEFPLRMPGQLPLMLELQGVDSYSPNAKNTLDTKVNVVVEVAEVPYLDNSAILAVIQMPRPRAIYYAISGDIQKDSLKGTVDDIGKIQGKPEQVSGIRIFVYTCPDFKKVQLISQLTNDTDPLWHAPKLTEGNPAKFPDRNVFVLHIYDEPPITMSTEDAQAHTMEEFNKSLEMMNVAVQMTKKAGPLELPNPLPPDLEGLISEELSTLNIRRRLVLGLLNEARGGCPEEDTGGGTGGQVCSGAHGVLSGNSSSTARQAIRLRGMSIRRTNSRRS
jgi:hypothetical protein